MTLLSVIRVSFSYGSCLEDQHLCIKRFQYVIWYFELVALPPSGHIGVTASTLSRFWNSLSLPRPNSDSSTVAPECAGRGRLIYFLRNVWHESRHALKEDRQVGWSEQYTKIQSRGKCKETRETVSSVEFNPVCYFIHECWSEKHQFLIVCTPGIRFNSILSNPNPLLNLLR